MAHSAALYAALTAAAAVGLGGCQSIYSGVPIRGSPAQVEGPTKTQPGCPKNVSEFGTFENFAWVENRPKPHKGEDFVGPDGYKPNGDGIKRVPIIATASGKVIFARNFGNGGNTVLINHGLDKYGNNVTSSYSHLGEIAVEVGQQIKRGDKVGTVGDSGYTGGSRRMPYHLHLGTMIHEKPTIELLNSGWPRKYNWVNPNRFSLKDGNGAIKPYSPGTNYGDSSGVFTGFTFALPCNASSHMN